MCRADSRLAARGFAHPRVAANVYQIADGHVDNRFIAGYLRIAQGRSKATRVEIGERLYRRLHDRTAELLENAPVAISYEVQDIDPVTRWNKHNLRSYLAERAR